VKWERFASSDTIADRAAHLLLDAVRTAPRKEHAVTRLQGGGITTELPTSPLWMHPPQPCSMQGPPCGAGPWPAVARAAGPAFSALAPAYCLLQTAG